MSLTNKRAHFLALLILLPSTIALGTPVYVDPTAPGEGMPPVNDGTTWTRAYHNLQDGIKKAWDNLGTYDEVRTAKGRYTPDKGVGHIAYPASGSLSETFRFINGVSIKGGYAGFAHIGTDPNVRDFAAYESILSGDLAGDDVPGDLTTTHRGDNSYCILLGQQPTGTVILTNGAVLDGFTITGANGGYSSGNGGGLFLPALGSNTTVSASPKILNCRFIWNVTTNDGAGIYCSSRCQPVITACTFEANQSLAGAGCYLASSLGSGSTIQTTSPIITSCKFLRNVATQSAPGAGGAGVYLGGTRCTPDIENSSFQANQAALGAAMAIDSVSSVPTLPILKNLLFTRNVATSGGGGAVVNSNDSSGLGLVNCIFIDNEAQGGGGGAVYQPQTTNLEFTNCVFSRNAAKTNGGAILNNYTGAANTLKLTNCSFSKNRAVGTSSLGGGVRGESQTTMTIRNCLFKGNISTDSSPSFQQISNAGATTTVNYSSIDGGWSGGSNNNNSDPLFVNAAADDLRIVSYSPARDSGDPSSPPSDSDPDGHARVLPSGGTVDRGSYELDPSTTTNDCNVNGRLDNDDIACVILGTCGSIPGSLDCNNNGRPDSCDIACIAAGTCGSIPGSHDCNHNGIPDECDIASGRSKDFNEDGIPDECVVDGFADCNGNRIADSIDIANGTSSDCNHNGVPDECESIQPKTWAGTAFATSMPTDFPTLINVSLNINNHLARNASTATSPLPYLWISGSKKGPPTVLKIATSEPADGFPESPVVGEYYHMPGLNSVSNTHPERTAVDLDGNAWAAATAVLSGSAGAVVRIGIVIGGKRVNAAGAPDANGEYLSPPFDYCTCQDRDGDGLIKTSRGITDILSWSNWDGSDTNGGVSTADDECIIRYVRASKPGIRAIAIDKDNNIYVGSDKDTVSTDDHVFAKIDGVSGLVTNLTSLTAAGGYGALINCGVLWSSTSGNKVVRADLSVSSPTWTTAGGGTPPPVSNTIGLSVDTGGRVWATSESSNTTTPVEQFTVDGLGQTEPPLPSGLTTTMAQGIAIRPSDGSIWVGDQNNARVLKLDSTGSWMVTIPFTSGAAPNGTAVDTYGHIWVPDKNTAPGHIDIHELEADSIANEFDLGGSSPTCIGDMTGMDALLGNGVGTWNVVHDGGTYGMRWCKMTWNTACAENTLPLEVDVRASDNRAGLALIDYAILGVSNSGSVTLPTTVVGRYAEIRVRFKGACPQAGTNATPILCDLTLYPQCLKGDINHDGVVDGRDIDPMIKRLLGCTSDDCSADLNNDNSVNVFDIPCFASVLLGMNGCATYACSPAGEEFRSADCNGNGFNDAEDIAAGRSLDCNNNGIPDECDVNTGDPDGNGLVSADVNSNGIPDECEPDCNHNGLPDGWDISQATSTDINSNGIPDECETDCNHNGHPDSYDIATSASNDCNGNGVPDECEQDCNSNGVPDDCDIANETSLDCNGNGFPDECDLALGAPFGSLDCNDNGIPDECDIASGYSTDANHNHIPDECEGGEMMAHPSGRGGTGSHGAGSIDGESGANTAGQRSSTAESQVVPTGGDTMTMNTGSENEDDAWQEFYDWALEQCWGPGCEMTGAEQFQAYVDELEMLGLPVEGLHSTP